MPCFAARRAISMQGLATGVFALCFLACATVTPAQAPAPTPNSSTWVSIGPQPARNTSDVGNVVGRVSAIAVHPTDPNIAYIGGAQGGVWKSTDAGATWTALTDREASLAIGAIAIDPTNPNIIYVGTGEQTNFLRSYYGAGILKSTDGGATWTQLGQNWFVGPFGAPFIPGGGARISSIVIHPNNPSQLLAGVWVDNSARSGVFCSDDAGVTWRNVLPGAAGSEVVIDAQSPNIAYAALGTRNGDNDNGVYRTTSANLSCAQQVGTWSRADTGSSALPTNNVGRIEIALAPTTTGNGAVLYAGIEDRPSNGLLGFFRSTDGGVNWARLGNTPDYCAPRCGVSHVVRVHPANADVVFAGGSTVTEYFTRTTDGGNSWSTVGRGTNGVRLHREIEAIAFANLPGGGVRVYVGTDGGAYRADLASPTDTPNWVNLNGDGVNLATSPSIMQFVFGPAMHPTNPDITYAGTQGSGILKFTGSMRWEQLSICRDGGFSAIDPDSPNTVFAACNDTDINRSTDAGATWTSADQGIPNERGAYLPTLVIDPNPNFAPFSGRPLYFGTYRVWQNLNGGTGSWTPISGDLTSGIIDTEIRTIAIAPTDSRVVYAATYEGRVWRTTNADAGSGANWTFLTTSALPPRIPTWISVSYSNPDIAYVSFYGFSGFSGDNRGHIFKTTNGGSSWQDISIAPYSATPLPNTPVNVILLDPDAQGTLYAATDIGVYVSNDDGVNWRVLGSGLPRVAVTGLMLQRPTRILRASTQGRGMWDLLLASAPARYSLSSISPASATAGGGDVTLTVNGEGFATTSIVRFGSTDMATACGTATRCTATIPASSLTDGGTVAVAVFDPAQPAPGTTNSVDFTVNNPDPTLTALSPTSTADGGPAFTLTLTGTGFTPSSEARWNGSARPTTFVSATQLTAAIGAADIAAPGTANISVRNPAPGGGSSANVTFFIGAALSNDNFANAAAVAPVPFTTTFNNAAATTESSDPAPLCRPSARSHSVWFQFTPAMNIDGVSITADGSGFDPVISAWTGVAGSLLPLGCDDDAGGPDSSSQISMNVTAGTTYYFMVSTRNDGVTGNITFTLSAPIADLSVAVAPAPEPVVAGGTLTYAATITNAGPMTGNNVRLSYALPANVTLASASVSGGSCANSAGVVTCTISSLAVGTRTASIAVTPGIETVGTLAATMDVTGSADPVTTNNSAIANSTVVPPDLSVSISDAPDPVTIGSNLTYTIVVSNAGPAAVSDASLTYTLPPGVTYVSSTNTRGVCNEAGSTVTCAISPLNSNGATVTIVVQPGASAANPLPAAVSLAPSDPNPANNSASTTTALTQPMAPPDLSVTLSDSPDPVIAGSNLTYTATLSNSGQSAMSNVALTYSVPANVAFVSASVNGGNCGTSGAILTCTIASLAAGTTTATIVVRPGTGAVGTLNASVTAAPSDATPANNSASTTTTVNPTPASPDFSISANPSSVTVARGQAASTTITLTASGGLSGATTFACAGLPAGATCTFSPATVTLGAQPVSTTLTVATAASGILMPAPGRRLPPQFRTLPWPAQLALFCALLAVMIKMIWGGEQAWPRRLKPALPPAALMLAAVLMGACVKASDVAPAPSPTPGGGTPPGSSNVMVTATSGSTTKSVPITLVVN